MAAKKKSSSKVIRDRQALEKKKDSSKAGERAVRARKRSLAVTSGKGKKGKK